MSRWLLAFAAGAVVALCIWLAVHFIGGPKSAPAQVQQYAFTGAVMAVKPAEKKVAVRNDNMPGFMESMIMDYDLKDSSLLSKLKPGDQIKATLLVADERQWVLDNVTVTGTVQH